MPDDQNGAETGEYELGVEPGYVPQPSGYIPETGGPEFAGERATAAAKFVAEIPVDLFNILISTGLDAVSALGILMGSGSAAAGPVNTWIEQKQNTKYPVHIATPQEAALAYFRGAIDEAGFAKLLERHGYNDDQQTIVKSTSRPLLPVAEAVTLWRRGELTYTEMYASLLKHGFKPEVVKQIIDASAQIPSVQDLILQLVREVFTPELRASLELDAEYPAEATAQFRRQGISEKIAKDYWAAHWRLPSATQGYQAYFRGHLDVDELDTLLRTLDYSPRYRKMVRDIAHKLLTRVDIRRIHALGLIDEEQLFERYKKLGYDTDNAQLMTDFTVAYNAAPTEEELADTRELTRAQILRFYDNGLFTAEEAQLGLVSLGYSERDSQTMILLRQMKASEDRTDDEIELVRRRFKNGASTYNQAVEELDIIDIPVLRRDIILQKLETERLGDIRLPTLAQLGKMLKKDVITPEIYRDQLTRLGYPDVWAERYMELMVSTPASEDPLEGTV